MTLEQLVEVFAYNVAAQTDAIFRCDPETGNQHADRYYDAFQELRARGDQGRDALAVLLKHPRPDVRGTAAACLLRHRTAEAIAVLEDLARQEGMEAFETRLVLARWKNGTWALDPG